MIKTNTGTLPTPFWKWESTEHQQLLVMYPGYSQGQLVADSHIQSIGCLYRKKRKRMVPGPILIISINGASTTVGLASWLITAWCGCYCLYTSFWLFCMLTGSWILSGIFVIEIGCYCPRGCRGNILCSSADIDCQLHVYGWLWSSITHIPEDSRPKFIDTPLMLHWRTVWRWGREGIAISFANEGGQYLVYGFLQPIAH